MRDSNYKSISNNRAAVTISSTVYDRRALDVTSDRPLVNSLNHLTYLVSSSAKVRETLSTDGGIERLIEILHECNNCNFGSSDNIFTSEKKILTAWKWTLGFQCLVLIGTRGTESIRQRVVRAGMLPIIATVLDNYITLHDRAFIQANKGMTLQSSGFSSQVLGGSTGTQEASQIQQNIPTATAQPQGDLQEIRPVGGITDNTEEIATDTDLSGNLNFLVQFETFQNNFRMDDSTSAAAAMAASSSVQPHSFFSGRHPDSLTNEDYESLSIEQLFKLVRTAETCDLLDSQNVNNIRRRYLILIIMKKLKAEKEGELLDTRFLNNTDYDMDNSLQFLSDMYLQDEKSAYLSSLATSKASPRSFTETGVIIPREDDIGWSLQLLAYISKYPNLKDSLQHTHLVIDISVRDKQLKLFIENQLKTKMKKDLAIKQRPTIKPKSRRSKSVSLRSGGETTPIINSGITQRDSANSRLSFTASASNSPQMINSLNSLRDDNFILDQDKLDLCDDDDTNVESGLRVDDTNVEGIQDDGCESDPEIGSVSESGSDNENFGNLLFPSFDQNKLSELYESILDSESIMDTLDREFALHELNEKISKCIERASQNLSTSITKKRLEQKQYLKQKWNYDTYENFNIDDQVNNQINELQNDPDYDDSLIEYKKVNLFPMVEKFTFLAGTDMYYWSGVVMRNSCRRNEHRGGVRQCGNLDCGKWETYPREFSKCRRCKRTKYCTRECQKKSWHCHRNWCIPSTSSTTNNANESQVAENDENEEPRTAQVQNILVNPSEVANDAETTGDNINNNNYGNDNDDGHQGTVN
ncbi:hypothetical protein PSN45_000267 [Yamadazyma tenuis]|uniref:MYND-type domain-containing protein n=1 Tax=Candida tenuis (strain ATCC 10573 / BCRC 21748 / CBS 615 / JCM 9827 / NBRC 10315 / NRRL Y-1498 / VKM Y-70) TaxID=590646 RepID=G3B781_CANTC|nr:uncharacterized protein CANTEDRAFT_94477 [Yamadazyma tenuis ATCC 10573]EGV61587.1 hypothetical protein CANTEDRAFT_94477 [Yamadazyma tenuis ATCC 10573]WEJ92811.1 hypothetical protein PSN45_000267 [Yamadazyma tenuis]